MATKTVTLKDSNGDTLYPVTDSNVVNINQQKTLAQALDGVVYAEDPTQNATPTAWVTGSDINWTTTAQSYSTTEVDTGATWIDDKPIYKKTINFGNLPNNSTKRVAHGVSGLSQLVKIDAIMNRPGANGGFYPLPFVSKSVANDQIEISVNGTNVSIATNIDWSSCTAYVTLWYTKTTD